GGEEALQAGRDTASRADSEGGRRSVSEVHLCSLFDCFWADWANRGDLGKEEVHQENDKEGGDSARRASPSFREMVTELLARFGLLDVLPYGSSTADLLAVLSDAEAALYDSDLLDRDSEALFDALLDEATKRVRLTVYDYEAAWCGWSGSHPRLVEKAMRYFLAGQEGEPEDAEEFVEVVEALRPGLFAAQRESWGRLADMLVRVGSSSGRGDTRATRLRDLSSYAVNGLLTLGAEGLPLQLLRLSYCIMAGVLQREEEHRALAEAHGGHERHDPRDISTADVTWTHGRGRGVDLFYFLAFVPSPLALVPEPSWVTPEVRQLLQYDMPGQPPPSYLPLHAPQHQAYMAQLLNRSMGVYAACGGFASLLAGCLVRRCEQRQQQQQSGGSTSSLFGSQAREASADALLLLAVLAAESSECMFGSARGSSNSSSVTVVGVGGARGGGGGAGAGAGAAEVEGGEGWSYTDDFEEYSPTQMSPLAISPVGSPVTRGSAAASAAKANAPAAPPAGAGASASGSGAGSSRAPPQQQQQQQERRQTYERAASSDWRAAGGAAPPPMARYLPAGGAGSSASTAPSAPLAILPSCSPDDVVSALMRLLRCRPRWDDVGGSREAVGTTRTPAVAAPASLRLAGAAETTLVLLFLYSIGDWKQCPMCFRPRLVSPPAAAASAAKGQAPPPPVEVLLEDVQKGLVPAEADAPYTHAFEWNHIRKLSSWLRVTATSKEGEHMRLLRKALVAKRLGTFWLQAEGVEGIQRALVLAAKIIQEMRDKGLDAFVTPPYLVWPELPSSLPPNVDLTDALAQNHLNDLVSHVDELLHIQDDDNDDALDEQAPARDLWHLAPHLHPVYSAASAMGADVCGHFIRLGAEERVRWLLQALRGNPGAGNNNAGSGNSGSTSSSSSSGGGGGLRQKLHLELRVFECERGRPDRPVLPLGKVAERKRMAAIMYE
ncbi:hypothetical protein Agub_g1244, partial [Astrephomene gubernaculifera]